MRAAEDETSSTAIHKGLFLMNTCPQEGIVQMYFTAPRHPPPVWSAYGDSIAIVPPPQLCLGSEENASFLLFIDLFQESFSGKSQASQQLSQRKISCTRTRSAAPETSPISLG